MNLRTLQLFAFTTAVVLNSGIARADFFGDIAEVGRRAVDTSVQLGTFNRAGNDRQDAWQADRDRAAAAEAQAKKDARSAAVEANKDRIIDLNKNRFDLSDMLTSTTAMLSSQIQLYTILQSIQKNTVSNQSRLEFANTKTRVGTDILDFTTVTLKVMLEDMKASGTPEESLKAYQHSMHLILELAKRNSVNLNDLIAAAIAEQVAQGNNVSIAVDGISDQLTATQALRSKLQTRLGELDGQIKSIRDQLNAIN